jgi:dihydroorotase-like cyclic amidohydrolase
MILIRGARQLLTLQGPAVRRGGQLSELNVIVDGSVLVDGDKIFRVGPTRQLENLREARRAHVIEAHGKVVMPGFVDSCTQMISGVRCAGAAWEPWRMGYAAAVFGAFAMRLRPPCAVPRSAG